MMTEGLEVKKLFSPLLDQEEQVSGQSHSTDLGTFILHVPLTHHATIWTYWYCFTLCGWLVTCVCTSLNNLVPRFYLLAHS